MNDVKELWEIYNSVNGDETFDYLMEAGVPDTAVSELPAIACNVIDIDETARVFAKRYCQNHSFIDGVALKAQEILDFAIPYHVPKVQEFLKHCSRVFLQNWSDAYNGEYERPKIRSSQIDGAAVVDLASGPEFFTLLQSTDKNTKYYFVDKSYFVFQCITNYTMDNDLENVTAIHKDIMELERRDVEADRIDLIRAKNVFTYVPTYLHVANPHIGWLSESGMFILAQRACNIRENKIFQDINLSVFIAQQIQKGFDLEYCLGAVENPASLNELVLSKNGTKSPAENVAILNEFNQLVTNVERYKDSYQ